MKIISQLQAAKSQLENDEKKEARRQLQKVRKQLKNTTEPVPGYSKSEFLSLLQMAEADVKLRRTAILEDVIADLRTKSTSNHDEMDDSADENCEKVIPDSVQDSRRAAEDINTRRPNDNS